MIVAFSSSIPTSVIDTAVNAAQQQQQQSGILERVVQGVQGVGQTIEAGVGAVRNVLSIFNRPAGPTPAERQQQTPSPLPTYTPSTLPSVTPTDYGPRADPQADPLNAALPLLAIGAVAFLLLKGKK